ncbi:trichohyalin-like, partial [Astyanax mexicanus]
VCVFYTGEFKLIGPRGREYKLGSTVTLSCLLSPELSAVGMEIRRFKETDCVCLYKNRQVTEGRSYEDRVSLITQELQRGNVSLQIRNCTESDTGDYLCQVTSGDTTEECTYDIMHEIFTLFYSLLQEDRKWTEEERIKMEESALLTEYKKEGIRGLILKNQMEQKSSKEQLDTMEKELQEKERVLRENIKTVEMKDRELEEKEKLLTELKDELTQRTKKLEEELKLQKEEMEKILLKTKKELNDIKQQLKDKDIKLKENEVIIKEHLESISTRDLTLKNTNERLESVTKELQEKNTQLEKSNKLLREKERELEKKEKEVESSKEQLETLGKELQEKERELEKKEKEVESSKEQMETLGKELQEKERVLEKKEKEVESSKEQLETLRKELQEKERVLEKKEKEVESSKEQLETLRKELQKKSSELQEMMILLEQQKTELREKDKQIEENERLLRERDTQIMEREKQVEEKDRLIEERNKQLQERTDPDPSAPVRRRNSMDFIPPFMSGERCSAVSPASGPAAELRLVLLGRTGCGKSAAGNSILGREERSQAGASTVRQQSESRQGEVAGRQVTVVETPDCFCPGLSLEELRQNVEHCVRLSAPGPHAFLLVLPVKQSTGEERGMLEKIEEMFGERCWRNTMILFTVTDEVQEKNIEEFIQSGNQEVQRLVEKCGNRFHCLNIKESGDDSQISELLEKMEKMVEENREKFYSSEIYLETQSQIRAMEIKIIREREEKRMMEEREIKEILEKEMKNSLRKIEGTVQEHEGEIKQLNDRTTELERRMEEERDEEKKRELERELKRELEKRTEMEEKVKELKEKREKEKREMEERHRQEMEEIRETYEGEARIEAERNLMKIILPELQKNILLSKEKMQEEFSRQMEEKNEEMQKLKQNFSQLKETHSLLEEVYERTVKLSSDSERAPPAAEGVTRTSIITVLLLVYLSSYSVPKSEACRIVVHSEFKLTGPQDDECQSGSVTLSCLLSPELSAVGMEIRWFKEKDCVCLYKNGKVTEGRSYEDRVSLITQELQRGNVSLQIRNCDRSDTGYYLCQVTDGNKTEECTIGVFGKELEKKEKEVESSKVQLETLGKELQEKERELEKKEKEVESSKEQLETLGKELQEKERELEKKEKEVESSKVQLETLGKELQEKERELEKKEKEVESISPASGPAAELRLVLLGRTGCGKSAAGNSILGREERSQAGASTVRQQSESRQGEVAGRQVTVVETPDCFCPGLSLEELRQNVEHCVRLSAPGPHAFLLVLPVKQSTGEERGMLEKMEEMFGERCWRNTMILFTVTDEVQEKNIEEFIQSGNQEVQRLVEKCGNRFHCLNIKESGDGSQISELLEKMEKMVEENREKFYSSEIYLETQSQIRAMETKIMREREEKRMMEEKEIKEKLEKEMKNSLNKIEGTVQEHEGEIKQLNNRTTELERRMKEERDEEKKRELERELKRELEKRTEMEEKVKKLKEKREKEKREMEERHKQEMEEIRETYEGEARIEAERNLMKIILPELQKNILLSKLKMQEEFSRQMEEKNEEMQKLKQNFSQLKETHSLLEEVYERTVKLSSDSERAPPAAEGGSKGFSQRFKDLF